MNERDVWLIYAAGMALLFLVYATTEILTDKCAIFDYLEIALWIVGTLAFFCILIILFEAAP